MEDVIKHGIDSSNFAMEAKMIWYGGRKYSQKSGKVWLYQDVFTFLTHLHVLLTNLKLIVDFNLHNINGFQKRENIAKYLLQVFHCISDFVACIIDVLLC